MSPAATERVLRPIEELAEREGLQPYFALKRTLGPTDHLHELLAFATERAGTPHLGGPPSRPTSLKVATCGR